MINNKICDSCKKAEVCSNLTILNKFDEEAKRQLGVDITIDECIHFDDAMAEAIKELED